MSTTPALVHVAQALDLAVVVTAVAVLARQARARHSPATRWALAMFSDLAVIVLVSFFPVHDDGGLLRHGYTVLLVSVLLLVPYLLVRFALSLGAVSTRVHRLALGLTGAELVATLASPRFPQPGEHRSGWFTAYVVLVLVGWTGQSVVAAAGLWRSGQGQPSVVRRRMQALGTGAVMLALALVASGATGDTSTSLQVTTSLAGVAAVCLLVIAFVVPPWLRAGWRATDLVRLGHAERGLMTAVTEQEVATAIVPAVVQLFGATGGALIDERGEAITAVGTTEAELTELLRELRTHPKNEVVVRNAHGWFACRLNPGWLVVRPGSFAPLFGPAEMHLLDRAGSFADLALQRCRLFAEQARSQKATEATNAELQTLIYSVSHDLRNPIISVLGYVDVLAREHAGQLKGDGEHYLQRISVNALYMQNLIQDLLELSRIGRSEPPPQAVPLGELAESVAHELRSQHPGRSISVIGTFPVAWLSELRARQLLTNLMDNAAKYGRDGELVTVQACTTSSGGAVITISDDGRGVPEHLRDKAFDVFERLDAAHTDLPGTGMGLPICRRIVETVGGSITLSGPADGLESGTTVTVELPRSVIIGWSEVRALEKEHVS
jgi:signal transduction histidine kinase